MEPTHLSTDRAELVEGGAALAGLVMVALLLVITVISAASVLVSL